MQFHHEQELYDKSCIMHTNLCARLQILKNTPKPSVGGSTKPPVNTTDHNVKLVSVNVDFINLSGSNSSAF